MKNKIILLINALWVLFASLNESGVLDLLPFDDKLNNWIKFIVAFIIAILNAYGFTNNSQRTVGPRPPKPPRG